MAGLYYQLHDKVTCPFDPAHVMNYSKFHSHFVKCQKAHPNEKRKQCPYNAAELVDENKLAEHTAQCIYIKEFPNVPLGPQTPGIFVDEAPDPINFGDDDEFPFEDSDEEMDSVSVIAEKNSLPRPENHRRLGRGSSYLLSNIEERRPDTIPINVHTDRNSSEFSVTKTQMPEFMKLGRGRGVLFNIPRDL